MSEFNKKIGRNIKTLRKEQKISQQRLADLLGVLRSTVSQMENGSRAVSVEELKKISQIFNLSLENMLDLSQMPKVSLSEQKIKSKTPADIRINVPQRNLRKFKEILLYILNKVGARPHIGETVMYKLLYFMDFDFYEKYEEQMIGATYIKNHHGPTPKEFKVIVDDMVKKKEVDKIKSKYFDYPQTKYLPLREPDLKILRANEIEVINDVLHRLADKNASQISEYSHNDVPWMTTEDGQKIEYESVFYRTAPYSVRKSDEDIQ